MRVIAGKYRSRRLQSLEGLDLRPTSDRLRETLFNVLCAGNPGALEGSTWLDLYAGTGAVGIEALSRGARKVIFVESSAKAAALIERNLRSLEAQGGVVMKADVSVSLRKLEAAGAAMDVVFLDPAYRMQAAYGETLGALGTSPLVKESTVVIAEHDRHFDPGEAFETLHRDRTLRQGDAVLSFYKLSGTGRVS